MPIEPPPNIDPVPTPVPSTNDPINFNARADAMLGWFPGGVAQIQQVAGTTYGNALAAYAAALAAAADTVTVEAARLAVLNLLTAVGRSSSSIEVSAGTKTIHTEETGRTIAVDDAYVLIRVSDPDVRLYGVIATSDGSDDFTMDVTSDGVSTAGAGETYSDWFLVPAWLYQTGATKAEVLELASALVSVTPLSMRQALEPYALTDGATVTPDNSLGLDFTWTIGGNRTLGAITNTYPGAEGSITITQDGTGSRVLAVNSAWKRQGGLGVLSTAAGAVDELEYKVKAVDGSGTATRIIYDILRAPSS